ncbi:MAG: hypothetical protein IPN74_16690 [Haliscomenobacter sp.]|nr:hypothetical protein [Haliscomenobacter sp.]MBK8880102.1 hypothetical protein [Haliscomenobacter sp.]
MTVKTKTIEAVPGNFSRELQQIFAEVVLGRSSAKCKHLGICKIENAWTNNFLDYMQATVENRLYGLASLKENDYFELAFPRSSLSPAAFEKHFGSGYFQLEEGFMTGPELMGRPIYLPKGRYQVKFSDSIVSVRFAL